MLGIAWYVVFLFSLTIHEAAHAWAAFRLGDPTAYRGGQVTLNPIPHIRREPFGTILFPLLSFAFYGWMMGWASAPYNPDWARHYPKRAGLMALAGPLSNFIATVAAAIGIRVGLAMGAFRMPVSGEFGIAQLVMPVEPGLASGVAVLLSILFSLNLLLFLFNLLPVPPLDGASAVQLVLPEAAARKYREIVFQPMYALIGLIVAWRLFGELFRPIFGVALGLLYF
jgi:Zn-dependent protease